MSVYVLLALVGNDRFRQMSDREIEEGMAALNAEIASDPTLWRRLSSAIRPSVEEIRSRRSGTWR